MKAVIVTDTRTGKETVYRSITDARVALRISEEYITKSLKRKYHQSNGYEFRYAENTTLPMPHLQAEVIMALADNGLMINKAAKALFVSDNTVRYQIAKIKEELGKNPLDFWDMIELVEQAKQVIALEERCRKEKERRA